MAISIAITCLLICLINLTPQYLKKNKTHTRPTSTIKFISINLNSLNKDWPKLREYLISQNPDIVAFFEMTPEWGQNLNELKSQFPYGKAVLQTDNFGIGIISKFALKSIEVHRKNLSDTPFIAAESQIFNSNINIIAAHPFPPIGSTGTLFRNNYLEQVSQFIQNKKSPTILCGDLNITPWSPIFKMFIKETGLTIATSYGALLGTWPSQFPSFLRIPIDHCLVSPTLKITRYAVGADIGSDHYPIEIEIGH